MSEQPLSSMILTIGFGSAVSMWGVGYVSRLPIVMLPSPLLLVLVLACLLGGGFLLGRMSGLGFRHGALAGALTGTINLLVLGSFLSGDSPGAIHPAAALWVPGSILLTASLGGLGAVAGRRRAISRTDTNWNACFARVAVVAVWLLLVVGGLVTSAEAGLAVVDWPNSFGYNMFLYPFSRMTGGIYYEHAHRLFGALVGLTTLALAIVLQRGERRRWVRGLAWSIVAMVVVQGIMGGLRVTGEFTMSDAPEAMRPSRLLAMVHGIFGQFVLASLASLAAFTSTAWRTREPREIEGAAADRMLSLLVLLLVVGQLVLGALQRHFGVGLFVHIAFGVAVAMPAAVHTGFRLWGRLGGLRPIQPMALMLVGGFAAQLLLGLGAFVAVRGGVGAEGQLLLATAHQGFGAALLALACALCCWCFRLLRPPD